MTRDLDAGIHLCGIGLEQRQRVDLELELLPALLAGCPAWQVRTQGQGQPFRQRAVSPPDGPAREGGVRYLRKGRPEHEEAAIDRVKALTSLPDGDELGAREGPHVTC
jgi:hypothetical protein